MHHPQQQQALSGIRVLDLGEIMQAPVAAQVLGDLGAEVIKVERGVNGDMLRGLDRESLDEGRPSAYFAAVNRNKRSIALNLKTPEGQDILHQLLAEADVLIHSYRTAAVERLGLTYDDLHERYPRLVYGTATGFGETGPYAHKAGQDMLAQALSGMARACGDPSISAYVHPVPTVDYASGMALAQGILAALFERERSGRGQKVSVNLFDTALALQTLESSTLLAYQRETNWVSDWYSGIFETTDGLLLVLGLFRENALGLACKALGIDDLSVQPTFATPQLQAENKEAANAVLRPLVAQLSTAEAAELFDGVDLLCAPLLTLQEALDHPQTRHNGTLVDVEIEGVRTTRLMGNPVTLSRTPAQVRRGVPAVSEHADEILHELGISESDVQTLRSKGVIR
ncbi:MULTISPECIES: CaiB/BaiF CoA transferase family protein [Rhodococcus]|uniref:CoA transferase n=2 Tax=Rhodococcus TaxID=1827 RepID=A0AA46SGP3_9NOCA|nr:MULTISPECIES: CaiB/BaiF CoA-transferase family protein [Rhodococcus]MCD2114279.1 CoA transferase [Rhodococcus rhodochrous]MCZ1074788.1 CaiB/BaiF CoA-transferase family protein [Rhodococcus sp. A5(2022)]MDV6296825.1 CaiB/BaiF CoA-transferase family protein [Rhodococcus aetherivorans]TWH52412.1 crotonobetainyl-CoA:carnitine CoA-transferase CaiB-like acyl-CoA transferase [Rhodococcus rhodochrous J38]UYF97324.1 CoA transferase [Rhodococcus aetherivorans]